MKASILSAVALVALSSLAVLSTGCSAAPEEESSGGEEALSLPEGEALTKYLETVFKSGTLDVPADAIAKPALDRLDQAVGANLDPLLRLAGTGLVDDGSEVIRVTQKNGKTSLLSFHGFKNADASATLGLVRVEAADGSVRTFAERDVVQGKSADGNTAKQVISTLYSVDDGGYTKIDNVVDDGTAAAQENALATSAFTSTGLHINAGDPLVTTFGSPKMCTACKGIVTGIKAAQPVLVFLMSHHFFTAACVGVGVAAGAAATPETLGAATIPAAAAGYRGCRIVMAGAAALIAVGLTMPDTDDDAGKTKYCNKVSSYIPGAEAWCVDNGPKSCALGTIHAAKDAQTQCVLVGACARDSKCPGADSFCSNLFLGDSASAAASRALCAKIDAAACSNNIQTAADLRTACTDLTAP